MRIFQSLVLAILALNFQIIPNAFASSGDTHLKQIDWYFKSIFGKYDKHAVQRGFQVYQEVCVSCHSLELISFRNLGQKGGPYFNHKYPNPNDNPLIKAFAAEYQIATIDELGDPIEKPGVPSNRFPLVYANDAAARAANGGSLPPDLSVIVKARAGGADYIYSILTGYETAPEDANILPGLYYNPYFSGKQIAMAPQLTDGIVEYQDGTVATPKQMAKDVVEFLAWAADPHMEKRKRTGLGVLIFLSVFCVLMYLSYREIWRTEKKKKTV